MPFVPVASNPPPGVDSAGGACTTAHIAGLRKRCDDLALIDTVCDGFEASWASSRGGAAPRPRIEGLVGDIPHRLYRDLLRELLRAEVEMRRAAGEAPTLSEYRSRFPRDIDVLAELFPDSMSGRLAKSVRIGNYELGQRLGAGGMGVVFHARQLGLNRPVAVKMLRAGDLADGGDLDRFRREAEALGALRHPNIVQVYEVGEFEDQPFFSMELVEGGSLSQKLSGTPLPPFQAGELVRTLALAVQAAHEKGIVHRDLKPANVLLAGDGTPKIADFGLAKVLKEPGATRSGDVVGTPSYMAPEQAAGHSNRVGPHTDVYALGTILYECLTGRPPFRADSELNTLLQVLREDPVAPRRLVPSVPRDLETICLKCLHKEPNRRYASAEALADDLGRFLGGMPVQARPVGRVERVRLWARRKPTAAALAAVSVLAVLLLVGSTTAYAVRLQRALKAEKEQHQQAVANLKRAREAVQRFFIKTSTSHLLNVPGLQQLRRELLQDALHFYQELVREYAGNPGIESELGATYEYMGSAYFVLGRGDEARGALEESLKIRRRLVAEQPGNAERRNELASTLANLGLVNQYTNPARALECYEEALRLREEVVAQEPTPAHRSDLADTLADLGTLLKGISGRAEQAMQLLERAHETREGLGREAPSEENTAKLAKLYNQLANLQTDHRRKPDALVNYKKALALRQALLKASPNNLTYLNDLAWSENNLGLLLSEIGTPEESLAHYERSMALRRRLAHESPAVIDFQHNLASSYNNLGLLYYRISGKEKEARSAFQEALVIRQKILEGHRGNLIYLARLGHIYQNLGNLESAIGKKEEALRSYEGALKIRREVAERTRRRPGELDALRDLAYTIGLVGRQLAALGRHEEALKLLEEARRLNRRLVDENPSDLKRKDHLGACLVLISAVLREQGRSAEALKLAEAGVAQARAASGKDRGVTEYQGNLARALHERGSVREALQERGAALADYREAVAISVKLTAAKKKLAEQQGELARGRFLLGRALRRGGQAEEAVAELRASALLRGALVRASPNNVGDRSELALTWSELGLALAEAGDPRGARVALTKAVEGQRECVARAPGFRLFARRLEEHRGALAGLDVRPTQ